MSTPRFIQITGTQYTVYALDEMGQVWQHCDKSRRICQPDPKRDHYDHQCQYQTVAWWEPLGTHRGGFPGWPPTEHEMAEREVEELLR